MFEALKMFRRLFCAGKLQNFIKVNVSGLFELLSPKNVILSVFHIVEENNKNMAHSTKCLYKKMSIFIENLRQGYIRNIGLSYPSLKSFEY